MLGPVNSKSIIARFLLRINSKYITWNNSNVPNITVQNFELIHNFELTVFELTGSNL